VFIARNYGVARFWPRAMPCSALSSSVSGTAASVGTAPAPRRRVQTLVNSAPKRGSARSSKPEVGEEPAQCGQPGADRQRDQQQETEADHQREASVEKVARRQFQKTRGQAIQAHISARGLRQQARRDSR
jgi:hypothetical protein